MSSRSTLGDTKRLNSLTDLDFNYNELYPQFKTLMKLASAVSGTQVSQLNLLDSITQWTVATNDTAASSISVEDCVCRFTVESGECLEIKDLSQDPRFAEKAYVIGSPNWKYYYGIPLETEKDTFVGTLCVLDRAERNLSSDQLEMLRLIADEITEKLLLIKKKTSLANENAALLAKQKQILTDLRNPLAGIIGITELVIDEPEAHQNNELIEINQLIHDNSRYILSITNKLLEHPEDEVENKAVFNLESIARSLEQLFQPQAAVKDITLTFKVDTQRERIPISRRKILQVIGMPLSNAIFVSQKGAHIVVKLDMIVKVEGNQLTAEISSTKTLSNKKGSEDPGVLLAQKYVGEQDGIFESTEKEGQLYYFISLPSFPGVS
ncbi:MAG: GAF domain-containing sensor histidine kinase [Daejeonella sp.]